MKAKYIKHYKNRFKIIRIKWRFYSSKYFRKNKGHLRRNLLRKYFKVYTLDQSKAITISIDRSQTNDFKAIREKLYGR